MPMHIEFSVNNKEKDEVVAQYLLSEFEVLNQRAMQYEQSIVNKTNFFLATLTAVGGGAILLSTQLTLSTEFYLVGGLILAVALLVLGITTLAQVVDIGASATFLYRRAGRIRKWFLEYDSRLQPYIPFVVGDDSPPYVMETSKLRGIEAVLLIANSAIAGFLGGGCIFTCWDTQIFAYEEIFSLIVGIVSFFVFWKIQAVYVTHLLRKWEHREKIEGWVHFPAEEQESS